MNDRSQDWRSPELDQPSNPILSVIGAIALYVLFLASPNILGCLLGLPS